MIGTGGGGGETLRGNGNLDADSLALALDFLRVGLGCLSSSAESDEEQSSSSSCISGMLGARESRIVWGELKLGGGGFRARGWFWDSGGVDAGDDRPEGILKVCRMRARCLVRLNDYNMDSFNYSNIIGK